MGSQVSQRNMKLISAILFACVAALALLHSVYGITLPVSASDAVPEPDPVPVPVPLPGALPITQPLSEASGVASNGSVAEMISAVAVDNGTAAARSPVPLQESPRDSSFVELSANADPLASATVDSSASIGSIDNMPA